ncbi:MAG: PD-(D/E)XK nuclease family protein [Phycisphaerales bacterium]|nr:MAG: PD-(D/E)XK nuclease family protein [Phycisphaerales bacterium]
MQSATIQPPYHQWMLNAYLACPEALRLTLLARVKPAFRHYARVRGTVAHATVFRLHVEKAWDRVDEVFEEEWGQQLALPGPPINANAKKLAKEFEDWRDALRQYVLREREARVVFCELPVRGTVRSRGGRPYAVEGVVDQVRPCADGGFDVYEIKTSAANPSLATFERNIQLSLYAWCLHAGEVFVENEWQAVSKVLGENLHGIVCYQLAQLIPYRRAGRRPDGSTYAAGELRGDPCYRITKTPEQLEQGACAVARIIAAIRAGGFFWNPSAMYGGCDACAVKHGCGKELLSNSPLQPAHFEAA